MLNNDNNKFKQSTEKVMKIGIVNHVPIIRQKGKIFVATGEYLALLPWIENMESVLLIKPEIIGKNDLSDFKEMPSKVDAFSLFKYYEGKHRPQRIKWLLTGKGIEQALKNVDAVYFRMSDWEGFRIWNFAYKRNLPTLLEIHGDSSENILYHNYGYIFNIIAKKTYSSWVHKRLQKMSQDANILVLWGEALAKKYSKKRKYHLRVPHHLNISDFYERQSYIEKGPYKILFIGPLQDRKGVYYLIEAINILREKNIDIVLDIVGDGPNKKQLYEQTGKHRLKSIINFHGQLPFGEKIMKFFRSADIFVLPSISADSVNRSIQEAMANTCPVITTFVGSMPEQLRYGELGNLVPPRDKVALAGSIESLLNNVSRRKEIAQRAFIAAKEFTYEKQGEKIKEIVKQFSSLIK